MGRAISVGALAALLTLSACSPGTQGASSREPASEPQVVRVAAGRAPVDWLPGAGATASVKVFFAYDPNVVQRRPPYTRPVVREIHTADAGIRSLELLFQGPRADEAGKGLGFVSSGASGISDLAVSGGIARVHLTGGCDADGAAVTVADQITATLKQFPPVEAVKVYGPDGTTQAPDGPVDSIPSCLAATMAPLG